MSAETLQILLVDDDENHVELIRRAFISDDSSFELAMAASLAEARQYLADHNPDLIICDYRLPDGRGIELLPGDLSKRTVPVIMLTGHGDEVVAAQAIKAGALDYIVKSEAVFADMPHIAERTMREWQNISERKQVQYFVRQTAEILRMIATGKSASKVYDAIALMYEERHPGMRCSILELKGNTLSHGGAPSLPKAYCDAVNGLQTGPAVGSCGTSTYTGKRVLVEDIATDPKWADLKGMALLHDLRCCWSEPVKSTSGQVLGAFGMYYNHPALPNEDELADLESAATLAGIVMEKEYVEQRLRMLSSSVEQASESVVITDKQGAIEYVNPAFTRITGYSEAEAIGRNPRMLNSGEQDNQFYEQMWDMLSSGNAWQGRIIDKRKDGSLYPALLTISPILEGSGEISHYVGVQQDISEYEEMEERFHQAQKMEAVGTLVGGIAHDFNNMLAGITGNLYLAKGKVGDLPEVVQKLDNIQDLSMRAADMIKQLLAFARRDRVDMKPIPFTYYIKEIIKLLRVSIPENIRFDQCICSDNLQMYGDSTQLHQVVMNLIGNARDAVEAVGDPVITIRLEPYTADAAFLSRHNNIQGHDFAHLSIKDNGCGIEKEIVEHIFEPYFTTKVTGKGTGLGLAMVFGAIQTHQGIIEVESVKGEGSIFDIYIPLYHEQKFDFERLEPQDVIRGQGELVLLVDDQQHIIETGKEVLECIGYRVVTAMNGSEAVELYKTCCDQVELIIIDVVMPVMGGIEAVRCFRNINHEVKVIFSTGYDKQIAPTPDADLSNEIVLSKPFSTAAMSHVVRKVLDS